MIVFPSLREIFKVSAYFKNNNLKYKLAQIVFNKTKKKCYKCTNVQCGV